MCVACPEGTDCMDYGQALVDLPVKQNHYRFTATSHKIYKCPYKDACKGAETKGTERSNATTNGTAPATATTMATAGNSLCVEGFRGPLCTLVPLDPCAAHTSASCTLVFLYSISMLHTNK